MSVEITVRPTATGDVYEFQVQGAVIAGAEGRWWLSSVSTRFRPEVAVTRIVGLFDSGPKKQGNVAVPTLPFDDAEPGA